MRILHVTDVYRPQVGGIEIFVDDLARQQAAAGHDVTVLTATQDREPAVAGSLTVVRASPARPGAFRLLPARQTVALGEYDVVHGHLSVLSPFSTVVAREAVTAGVPTLLTVHSMWGGRTAVVRAAGALAGWNQWPAVWTAVSEAAAVDMRRVIRTRPVVVVPNAVEVDWWRETGRGPITAARKDVTLISVMRLAGRKRPLALARMLRDVRRSVPPTIPLKAVIVGDGPLEGRLRSTIERFKMTDWVSMPGCLSRAAIRDRYRTADLYLAPAHRESFGIAALEARAAGLPVLAMRSGGVGEFIQDGVEGLLCDDDRGMARAVAHLVTQRGALAGMAARNTAFVPNLGWDVVLDRFSRAYALAAEGQLANRSRRTSLAVPAAVFDNG